MGSFIWPGHMIRQIISEDIFCLVILPHQTIVNSNPSIHHNTRILIISILFLFIEIKHIKENEYKICYSTKKYDSKLNVYLRRIKLASNIYLFIFTILMFSELKYLKQGFIKSLSVFVLSVKNNSFPNS